MGIFFHFSSFVGENTIFLKPGHFVSAQMTLLSSFFQVLIVLGMYNFSLELKVGLKMEFRV